MKYVEVVVTVKRVIEAVDTADGIRRILNDIEMVNLKPDYEIVRVNARLNARLNDAYEET